MRRFLVQAQGEMWNEPRSQRRGSMAKTGTPPRRIAHVYGTIDATANTASQGPSNTALGSVNRASSFDHYVCRGCRSLDAEAKDVERR